MKHLKMLKHARQLNPGEFAGFEDADADTLVASGHAVEYTPEAPEAPTKAEKKAKAEGEAK